MSSAADSSGKEEEEDGLSSTQRQVDEADARTLANRSGSVLCSFSMIDVTLDRLRQLVSNVTTL